MENSIYEDVLEIAEEAAIDHNNSGVTKKAIRRRNYFNEIEAIDKEFKISRKRQKYSSSLKIGVRS
jgi:hypothetical protein